MRFALAALLVACSQPAPAPQSPTPTPTPTISNTPIDAPGPSEEEKLAAIQKAMNELDEAAQGCWAMAATDRFDIAGDIKVLVDIMATDAKTQITSDTVRNKKLADCLQQLLAAYKWAPPLYGQSIQLPFAFQAPAGQSVIDRQLVEWHGQSNVSVAVLLDENNSGNPAASMFEVAIPPRATTGMRVAERAELWYFLGDAEVKSAQDGKDPRVTATVGYRAKAGEMLYVPAGTAREIGALQPEFRAVVVIAPGGREGAARAGALPTVAKSTGKGSPKLLKQGTAHGPAMIFLEPSVVKDAPFSASVLALPAGANVPEHVHAKETELLYVLEGSGTMTIAGQEIAVMPTSVIQIPANTKHAFTAKVAVRALQLYTPPGPEQRFKGRK